MSRIFIIFCCFVSVFAKDSYNYKDDVLKSPHINLNPKQRGKPYSHTQVSDTSAAVGKWISDAMASVNTGSVYISAAADGYQLVTAMLEDMTHDKSKETVKTVASIGGDCAGAYAGSTMGGYIGGIIGSAFGGVGAVPGAAVGSVIGGLFGSSVGRAAGRFIAEEIVS